MQQETGRSRLTDLPAMLTGAGTVDQFLRNPAVVNISDESRRELAQIGAATFLSDILMPAVKKPHASRPEDFQQRLRYVVETWVHPEAARSDKLSKAVVFDRTVYDREDALFDATVTSAYHPTLYTWRENYLFLMTYGFDTVAQLRGLERYQTKLAQVRDDEGQRTQETRVVNKIIESLAERCREEYLTGQAPTQYLINATGWEAERISGILSAPFDNDEQHKALLAETMFLLTQPGLEQVIPIAFLPYGLASSINEVRRRAADELIIRFGQPNAEATTRQTLRNILEATALTSDQANWWVEFTKGVASRRPDISFMPPILAKLRRIPDDTGYISYTSVGYACEIMTRIIHEYQGRRDLSGLLPPELAVELSRNILLLARKRMDWSETEQFPTRQMVSFVMAMLNLSAKHRKAANGGEELKNVGKDFLVKFSGRGSALFDAVKPLHECASELALILGIGQEDISD